MATLALLHAQRRPSLRAGRLATAVLVAVPFLLVSRTSHAGPIGEVRAVGHILKRTVEGVVGQLKREGRAAKYHMRQEAAYTKSEVRKQSRATRRELVRQVRLSEAALLSGASAGKQVRRAERGFERQSRAIAHDFRSRARNYERKNDKAVETDAGQYRSSRREARRQRDAAAAKATRKVPDARKAWERERGYRTRR